MQDGVKRYYVSTATLIGTIIGVGIFGVPYAIAGIGVVPALLYFAVLGGIQLLQHLFYAEVAIATSEKLRLPGLVEKYLGARAKKVTSVATILGFWGGQLAYVIVGGTFLHALLVPLLGGEPFHYQLFWGIAGAAVIYFGLDFVTKVDFYATIGLLAAMFAILIAGAFNARADNFVLFAAKDLALPYGVILFSLGGLSAIPEMEDILKGDHSRYRRSIVVGSLAATLLTAAFGFVVWGVTGFATTQDSVAGLAAVFGKWMTLLIAAFGFLAVATSYFATGLNLRSTFSYDYRQGKVASWLLAVGVPFLVFLAGAKSFLGIISFSGAVFGGITAVAVAWLYVTVTKRKLVKEKPLGAPLWMAYLSIGILAVGASYEIWTTASALMR